MKRKSEDMTLIKVLAILCGGCVIAIALHSAMTLDEDRDARITAGEISTLTEMRVMREWQLLEEGD